MADFTRLVARPLSGAVHGLSTHIAKEPKAPKFPAYCEWERDPPPFQPVFKNNIVTDVRITFFEEGEINPDKSHNLYYAYDSTSHNMELNSLFMQDPQFEIEALDGRLLLTSAAIDAGTPFVFSDTDSQDIDIAFDKNNRARTDNWDIGVFEYMTVSIMEQSPLNNPSNVYPNPFTNYLEFDSHYY